jgi:putative endonuclease
LKKSAQTWKLYILHCSDGTLYTGITTNLERRITEHESGKGAKYTRGRAPLKLVYTESFQTKSSALMREAKIKSLTKAEKMGLITLCRYNTP